MIARSWLVRLNSSPDGKVFTPARLWITEWNYPVGQPIPCTCRIMQSVFVP